MQEAVVTNVDKPHIFFHEGYWRVAARSKPRNYEEYRIRASAYAFINQLNARNPRI
jgi:hypothetical protein